MTALVCAMQAPSLDIVNINVKLEMPSLAIPGPDRSAGRSSRLDNWRIKCQHSLGNVSWKNTFQNFFYFNFRCTKIFLKFEIGGGNRVNQ